MDEMGRPRLVELEERGVVEVEERRLVEVDRCGAEERELARRALRQRPSLKNKARFRNADVAEIRSEEPALRAQNARTVQSSDAEIWPRHRRSCAGRPAAAAGPQ